jgi:hypothetical protein
MLELMVYNRFHRMFNVAFHEAVRALARRADHIPTYEEELEIAKAIAATEPIASSPHVAPFRRSHESHLADALIQPLEYGYTVESLNTLANACGLDLMLPCYDQYDRVAGRVWTIDFSTKELNDRMDALPDVGRWQVVNLLLLERSPMLWFYLCRHRESSQCYEKHVNQEYLDRKFVRASTRLRNQVRGSDMTYALAPASVQYPFEQQNTVLRDVVRSASGKLTMRELLVEHGVDTTNHKAVTDIRMRTATSLCPYLRSV